MKSLRPVNRKRQSAAASLPALRSINVNGESESGQRPRRCIPYTYSEARQRAGGWQSSKGWSVPFLQCFCDITMTFRAASLWPLLLSPVTMAVFMPALSTPVMEDQICKLSSRLTHTSATTNGGSCALSEDRRQAQRSILRSPRSSSSHITNPGGSAAAPLAKPLPLVNESR